MSHTKGDMDLQVQTILHIHRYLHVHNVIIKFQHMMTFFCLIYTLQFIYQGFKA